MNLGNFKTKIKTLTDTSGESNIDNLITDWVNLVQQDIVSRNDWKFLETSTTISLSSNTQFYSLPSDFYKVYSVRVGNYYLRYIPQQLLDEVDPGVTTSGNPIYYTIFEGKIGFYPVPTSSGTANLRYFKDLADLSSDSDSPSIPTRFHYVILYGVLKHVYAYMEDQTKLSWADNEYERGIIKMRQSEEREPNRFARIRLYEPYSKPENYPHIQPQIPI